MSKPQTLSPLARLLRQQQQQEVRKTAPSISEPPPNNEAPTISEAPQKRENTKQNTHPSISEPPPVFGAPPKKTLEPLRFGGAPVSEPPPKFAAPSDSVVAFETPHTRIVNKIFDEIMPTLPPSSQVVLWRLIRLSIGFGTSRCRASIGKLAQNTNIKPTQLREHLRILESRGFIKRVAIDIANKSQRERGIEFQINIPRIVPPKNPAPSEIEAPPVSEPNKVILNKTHTNTRTGAREDETVRVCVNSRFTLAECRRYAESLRHDGITNPGGYATKIHRSGEADTLIEEFLKAKQNATVIDVSQCLECNGTGFYYPQGNQGGVVKCRHEKLREKASER